MILHGHGPLTWHAAAQLLTGCACTWSDLDGIHFTDEPPCELPPGATHLWGWDGKRRLRVRFDDTDSYVAVLSPTDDPEAGFSEPVAPEFRTATLWGPNDKRVGQLPPGMADRTWELAELAGSRPITFVSTRATG